jgi:hypothetical protein
MMTYDQLEKLLKLCGFSASKTENEGILTGFSDMEFYRNQDGQTQLVIFLVLEEFGNYLRMTCPRLYRYKEGPYKADLFQSCLMLNYWSKMLQFEYDDRDGEIRCSIKLPLEDNQLTQNQLYRCVTTFAYLLDKFDPMLRKTIQQGGVYVPRIPQSR